MSKAGELSVFPGVLSRRQLPCLMESLPLPLGHVEAKAQNKTVQVRVSSIFGIIFYLQTWDENKETTKKIFSTQHNHTRISGKVRIR